MMLAVLAQSVPLETPTTIVGAFIFVCVTVVGVVVWLVHHLLGTTIPKDRDMFATECKAQRDQCAKDSEALRMTFERRHDALLEHASKQQEAERVASERRVAQAMIEMNRVQSELLERFDRTDGKIDCVEQILQQGDFKPERG